MINKAEKTSAVQWRLSHGILLGLEQIFCGYSVLLYNIYYFIVHIILITTPSRFICVFLKWVIPLEIVA